MNETGLNPILRQLRGELERILGDQLYAVFLFGSRARGDARPDSDVDLLVVVQDAFDYGDLIQRTSEIVSALSLQHDLVISRSFVTRKQFEQERSPFMLNVHREAVPV